MSADDTLPAPGLWGAPAAPGAPSIVFVKLFWGSRHFLVPVRETADFSELCASVSSETRQPIGDEGSTWRLEWEDLDRDRIEMRNQTDWLNALEYQRQVVWSPRSHFPILTISPSLLPM